MGARISGYQPSRCLATAIEIEADIRRLATGLSESQFHAPSRNGGWSVGFCVEHLVLMGAAFFPAWDCACRSPGDSTQYSDFYAYTWWQRLILRSWESPLVRSKTTLALVPTSRRSIEETTQRFFKMHRDFAKRVEQCLIVDPRRTRIESPLKPGVHYPLGLSFDLVLAHERRHLQQAWAVRRQYLPDSRDEPSLAHQGKDSSPQVD